MPTQFIEAAVKKKRKKETSQGGKEKRSKNNNANMIDRFLENEIIIITGHQSEVIGCAWNQDGTLLASVAGDDTARLWSLPPDTKLDPESVIGHEIILNHEHPAGVSKEVTTLDWRPDGSLLATGCYDGKASLWTPQGALSTILEGFSGPIFALRWSPSGKLIGGAGVDRCAIIWDASSTGTPLRLYQNHSSPTLDLDWRDDSILATCTTDKLIFVYDLSQSEPIFTFQGHTDEVNCVRWSPDGIMLASCSDDATARIWIPFDEGSEVKVLRDHEKEIYCLKWSPKGSSPLLLATASFDHTVRLWNPLTAECVHVLKRHTDPVYAIGFSPDGRFIASGSLDETLNVWSVETGQLIRTYDSGRGGIFELAWSPSGDRLAICTSDSTVCVFDFRP